MASYVIATNKTATKFIDDTIYHNEDGLKKAKARLKQLRDERPDSADRFRIYPMTVRLGDPIE